MLSKEELRSLVSTKLKNKFKLRKASLEKMESDYSDTINKYCDTTSNVFLKEEADVVSSLIEINETLKDFDKRYDRLSKRINSNLKPKKYSLNAYKREKDKYTQEAARVSAGIK